MLPEWFLNNIIKKRGRKMRVDDVLKICPVCNRAWEYMNNKSYKKGVIWYETDAIPKIGKKKMVCKDCQ